MDDNQRQFLKLQTQLQLLLRKQDQFYQDVNAIEREMQRLKKSMESKAGESQTTTEPANKESDLPEPSTLDTKPNPEKEIPKPLQNSSQSVSEPLKPKTADVPNRNQPIREENYSNPFSESTKRHMKSRSELEKFVGENLINKIGILITILGVGIGAKYSIEHDLISPLTRIILGYLSGIGLLSLGIYLKNKYENYSAVLVSGAIAILYFITFFAYSIYDLIPQGVAFGLMVLFTVFSIIASLAYNNKIIALIGLVGAYAIPFLLSNDSGRPDILFTYIAIINVGILYLSFKKDWKILYYSAFILTWIIYLFWYVFDFKFDTQFNIAFTFVFIFFVIFYITFLAYKIIRKEKFDKADIIFLLFNSFIFFAVGYNLIDRSTWGEDYLGLFTVFNALIHFTVAALIYKRDQADKNLFYFVIGLVLVFITIAIPIQLNGNWVTYAWIGEAALLFWIGRKNGVAFYEKMSYPLMALAFFSLTHDWDLAYGHYNPENPNSYISPLANVTFLTSIIFILGLGLIYYTNEKIEVKNGKGEENRLQSIVSKLIPIVLIVTIFVAFYLELNNYWDQKYRDSFYSASSEGNLVPNDLPEFDMLRYKGIWIINYCLLFCTALTVLAYHKIKEQAFQSIVLVLGFISIAAFLFYGLYELSELRESYLRGLLEENYNVSQFNLYFRYISIAILGITLYAVYRLMKKGDLVEHFRTEFEIFLAIVIIWLASSELLNWLDIEGSKQTYKLGLSILWGAYSLILIGFGIWKNKQYLRIAAIVLFAITLIKLFFYDIYHLNTISKTIVFVSLGVLLLIISFLYNKYKQNINNEEVS